MKRSIQISALVVFGFFIFQQAVLAGVEISLKNGRKIIADRCKDSEGKLTCDKSDGTFTIDKKDVLGMKTINIERTPSRQLPEEESASSEKEADKSGPDVKGAEKQTEGTRVKGPGTEEEKRLDEITRIKLGKREEREMLVKEREQLRDDVKNAGLIRSKEQFDSIQKRITDLDEKINKFNEEVNKLNEEEKKILGSINSKQ